LPHFFAINRAKRAKNAQSEVARTGHSAGHRRALDWRAHKKYDNDFKDSTHTRIREKVPQVSPLKAKRGSTHCRMTSKHAKIKKNEDFLHFFAKIFCHMKNL
jgi:hypothetical protein